jgi:hypothetical protein
MQEQHGSGCQHSGLMSGLQHSDMMVMAAESDCRACSGHAATARARCPAAGRHGCQHRLCSTP